jgi:hypothetical protein
MGKGFDAKPTPGSHGYDARSAPGRASNTGQRTSPPPQGVGIGQHRATGSGAPGEQRGQRGTMHPGANVGQYGDSNGSAENMKIGPTRKDADISSTSMSAGPRIFGEQPGADDQK